MKEQKNILKASVKQFNSSAPDPDPAMKTGRQNMTRRLLKPTVACGLLTAGVLSFGTSNAQAGRPRVLTTAEERGEIRERIEQCDSTAAAYEKLKERIKPFVERHAEDPEWFISRMPMNWDTHYTTDLIKDQRWVGGEGKAPVPTPRYQGMRQHLPTSHALPGRVLESVSAYDKLRPYGDKDGLIWAENRRSGEWEWAEPKDTRQGIGTLWSRIMDMAQDAAFIYWLEGENAEPYAEFASDILWTFMHGFSYKEEPRVIDGDGYQKNILTLTTLQCVGADPFGTSMCAAYDYVHDHLQKQGRDTRLIEEQLKRMADKVIENGFSGPHNWNIAQNSRVASAAMALDDDDAYEDGRGRSYYIDIVLNADQSRQTGLLKEVEEGMCEETGLWPEHGYGIGVPAGIMRVALQLSNEPAAVELLDHPSLKRVLFSQYNLTFPDGLTPGIGIGGPRPINHGLAERRLAWALERNDEETATRIAALLRREIESGRYEREERVGIDAVIRGLPELPETEPFMEMMPPTATFYAPVLNILMLRNLPNNGDPEYAVAAALYGSYGRQSHANGLAIELFGVGHILGVDPRLGPHSRHHQSQEYYGRAAAHNTVIVKGRSSGRGAMHIRTVQPPLEKKSASEAAATDTDFVYAQGELRYDDPASTQERTLALIRIDEKTAFFFDVFRSRMDEPDPDEYHDYLYQNRSDRMELTDAAGEPLSLERSRMLTSEKGNIKGYDYFDYEHSVFHDGDIRVKWPWKTEDGDETVMELLMPGVEDRRIFRVDAPNMRGESGPLRKLIVRQHGEAWEQPFVAVYAPRHADQAPTVQGIETMGKDSWRIHGEDWSVELNLEGSRLEGDYKKTVRE